MEKKTEAKVGLGFFEALGLLFIALKLCGVIAWSWWLVLLPIWGSIVLVIVIAVIVVIVQALSDR